MMHIYLFSVEPVFKLKRLCNTNLFNNSKLDNMTDVQLHSIDDQSELYQR